MTKLKSLLKDRFYLKICAYIAFTSITLFIVYKLLSNFGLTISYIKSFFAGLAGAFAPVLIGILIAYLLNPVVNFVDAKIISKIYKTAQSNSTKEVSVGKLGEGTTAVNKTIKKLEKRKKNLSILITFLIICIIILLIIYAIAVLIMGQIAFSSISDMIDSIINYFMKNIDVIQNLQAKLIGTGFDAKIQEFIESIFNWLARNTDPAAIMNAVSNVGSSVFNIALGIIVSIYLLIDREYFIGLCSKTGKIMIKEESYANVVGLIGDINVVIGRFLRGQLLDGLIIAILSAIGLSLIGLEFAIFIGFFAGIANIIPYFGPILGMIPAVAVALLTGDITQAIFAVLILFGIQQVDSAIISPRVVGTSTGLHPVFVLAAVTVGGYYMGIIGMLIAVPIAAIIKLLIERKFSAIYSE